MSRQHCSLLQGRRPSYRRKNKIEPDYYTSVIFQWGTEPKNYTAAAAAAAAAAADDDDDNADNDDDDVHAV